MDPIIQDKIIVQKISRQLKNGTVKIYTYNQKQYNDNYFNKHKEELLEKIKCPVCDGSYNRTSKSRHLKSKKHLNKMT